MRFFIYALNFDINSGGSIVLHRLCHLINTLTEHSACLVPLDFPIRDNEGRLYFPAQFKTNPQWHTPVVCTISYPENSIVIYPEITNGNPLGIKNVVRWLLHQPGFHTGKINYGAGELYYKFNSAIDDFYYENSRLSELELKVIYYPIQLYYQPNQTERDIECCHMVRKGKTKTFIHDENSIALDDKSHEEIAQIFKRAKRFICYDDYTAYSIFAVLAGCESIVVPAPDISIEQWYPNITDRYGIAYGFSEEQLQWARETKHKVLEHVIQEHQLTDQRVLACINEMCKFFGEK